MDIVRNQVEQHATVPDMADILKSLVNPPSASQHWNHISDTKVREVPSTYYGIDYLSKEAKNHSLGRAGEQFVVRFEQARLLRAGRENLAAKVEHVSATQGDGAGFDVLSFDVTGRERFIEVKTTSYGPLTPFFVTQNEVATSHRVATDYYLYRSFDFRRVPKLFTKQGPLDKTFRLDPMEYVASLM